MIVAAHGERLETSLRARAILLKLFPHRHRPRVSHLRLAALQGSRYPSMTPSRVALRPHLAARQKVWLNWDGAFLMCPMSLRFLAAVERTGTIRAAGQIVGWSYRTCLNRIRQMERALGAKMLATTRGGLARGGARLTPEARRLVHVFAQWQRAVDQFSRRAFQKALAL